MCKRVALLACLTFVACGRDAGVLALDVGRERDTLNAAPTPTRWDIGFTKVDDPARTSLGSGAWPSGALEIELDQDSVGRFDVTFSEDSGRVLAFGQTPFLTVEQLPGRQLSVFVQRRGELARPTPDLDGRKAPVVTVASERLLVVGGGSPALSAFDLALGGTLAEQKLTITPEALGATQSALFATSGPRLVRFDLETAESSDVALPSGVAATELAGGALLTRAEGYAWVGPARSGEPTQAIVFGDDTSMQITRLPEPRAAMLTSVLGDGALLLADARGAFRVGVDGVAAVPFPSFEHPTAVAVLDDGSTLITATSSGIETAFRAPPGCDASCAPARLGDVPCATRSQMLALGGEALLICDDASGATHAFRLVTEAPVEIPLREPRSAATLVRIAPLEAALIGGGPASFERYRPL